MRLPQHGIACYAAHGLDRGELLSCASGGVATALSKAVLKAGGWVCGVRYGADFRSTHYICTNRVQDLEALKGSKYIQSQKDGIFPLVKERLEKGLVLFVGTPCDVGALKGYLGGDHANLLSCDLICHGITSPRVGAEYIDHLEESLGAPVISFTVRHKEESWYPAYLRGEAENGKLERKPFFDTAYGYAFSYFLRPSCYRCSFKGENRLGDITLGDYLGMEPEHPGYQREGVSAVMVNTPKGLPWMERLSGISLVPVEYGDILSKNKRLSVSSREKPQREMFSRAFVSKSLLDACRAAGWEEKE
jgi:coenzyme F420-reducing hydrogenase beta subunit